MRKKQGLSDSLTMQRTAINPDRLSKRMFMRKTSHGFYPPIESREKVRTSSDPFPSYPFQAPSRETTVQPTYEMARSRQTVLRQSPRLAENKNEIVKINQIMGNVGLTPVKDRLKSPRQHRKEHEVRKTQEAFLKDLKQTKRLLQKQERLLTNNQATVFGPPTVYQTTSHDIRRKVIHSKQSSDVFNLESKPKSQTDGSLNMQARARSNFTKIGQNTFDLFKPQTNWVRDRSLSQDKCKTREFNIISGNRHYIK